MNSLTKDFYSDCYVKTGGFIPSKPLNYELFPGDFFQIHNGNIWVLGNIFKKGIIDRDEVVIESPKSLNQATWAFNKGVTKPFSGRARTEVSPMDIDVSYSKQILAFNAAGSFIFNAAQPEVIRIANWSHIADALIIKLTQSFYSFREVYVVTECASANHWTLAVSGSDKGELELATEEEDFGTLDFFGHETTKIVQSRDIELHCHFDKRIPSFFKAKRLAVQEHNLEVFMSDLIRERSNHLSWGCDYFDGGFENDSSRSAMVSQGYNSANYLDLLAANELNPNTALSYFKWTNTTLDDVVKLFEING
ncbi:MAG: hypothetical protein ABJM06_07815 [Gilvibacter sp.]